MYRIALGALNLRHDKWPDHRECPEPTCPCTTETIDHIVWSCDKAQHAWKRWLDQWLGVPTTLTKRKALLEHVASRKSPTATAEFLSVAQQCITRWTTCHDKAMEILWLIWTTTTPVILWRLRNRHIFNEIHTSKSETASIVWGAGTYQVMAVASSWKAQPSKRILGVCLELCHRIMISVHPEMDMEHLETWLIRYYARNPPGKESQGGWLVYHLEREDAWKLHVAGSNTFNHQQSRSKLDLLVLEQAGQAICRQDEPQRIILLIDTINSRASSMLRKDSEDKADYNDCRNLSALASFFRIQWRKPKLAAFTAAKKLAAMDQNATYIFDNTNRMTHRSAFEEYLQNKFNKRQTLSHTERRTPLRTV